MRWLVTFHEGTPEKELVVVSFGLTLPKIKH
jgi:hypothetical protein